MRLGSSLRVRSAEATRPAAEAAARRFGVTRVTDITRLDRLGLPVFAGVRPRGRTLRVHAGKGLAADDARIGALMEAVEFAACEAASAAAVPLRLTADELMAPFGGALRLADFAPVWGSTLDADRRLDAVPCEWLGGPGRVPVPAELVLMPFVPADGPPLFGASSNGLASGSTPDEATLHALFEVLERDTVSLHQARDASWHVPPASLPPPFDALARDWAARGVRLLVRELPNEFGLPCFSAHLFDDGGEDLRLAAGTGLHADPGIALARAVCEAAQSRLTIIHGGRDDITVFYDHRAAHGLAARRAVEAGRLEALADATRTRDFADVPALPVGDDPSSALAAVLARLAALGFRHVFRHRFGNDLDDLAVVRVVVARCEHLIPPLVRLGPRAAARRLGHG